MTTSIPIAASSLLLVLNAAPPDPGGDVPWWASLILLPVLAVVIEAIRRQLKLDQPPPPPPPAQTPQPQEASAVPATSADAKLDRAEKYVGLLEEIKAEQAAEIAKQDAEIAELRSRVDWLEGQLRALMDRFIPPPQPPQRSPGWTPPPGA